MIFFHNFKLGQLSGLLDLMKLKNSLSSRHHVLLFFSTHFLILYKRQIIDFSIINNKKKSIDHVKNFAQFNF